MNAPNEIGNEDFYHCHKPCTKTNVRIQYERKMLWTLLSEWNVNLNVNRLYAVKFIVSGKKIEKFPVSPGGELCFERMPNTKQIKM